jgi:transcriptional regulator with XRE-family HTH domain
LSLRRQLCKLFIYKLRHYIYTLKSKSIIKHRTVMEILIGQKIKEVVIARGMKINEFAKQINMVRQNAYKIFAKQKIDTKLLIRISEILDYDFFQYIQPNLSNPKTQLIANELVDKSKISEEAYQALHQHCQKLENELQLARQENNYLKKIIDLMEDKVKLISAKLPENESKIQLNSVNKVEN